MTVKKLESAEWGRYFDKLSKKLGASTVDVIVSGLDLGVQPEAKKIPLLGISYDHADQALHIAMRHLNHRIEKPEHIYVDEDSAGVRAIEAVDQDGHKQIVELSAALPLGGASN
jgi:hypothetical protein